MSTEAHRPMSQSMIQTQEITVCSPWRLPTLMTSMQKPSSMIFRVLIRAYQSMQMSSSHLEALQAVTRVCLIPNSIVTAGLSLAVLSNLQKGIYITEGFITTSERSMIAMHNCRAGTTQLQMIYAMSLTFSVVSILTIAFFGKLQLYSHSAKSATVSVAREDVEHETDHIDHGLHQFRKRNTESIVMHPFAIDLDQRAM